MAQVGFIGLGAMGTPMAWNLHRAGMLRAVYTRTPEKTRPFAEQGVRTGATPAELAAQADVILTMVADDAALADVLYGPDGVLAALREEAVVLNMSTVSVEATDRAAAAVRERGGRFVDAPVSGSTGPARKGTLVVLASGPEALVDEVRPVLGAVGNPVIYCGEAGQGTRMKLSINLLLAGVLQSFAEALVLARKHGLPLEKIQEVIAAGSMNAPFLQAKGDAIAARDFSPTFTVSLLLKDLDLILQAGRQAGVYLPQTAATREAVSGAQALGCGDEDIAAVVKLLEYVAGLDVEAPAARGMHA